MSFALHADPLRAGLRAADALPTVSVIIPCHNSAATIEECVRSAFDQDYLGPIEVCVFDDMSTDGTAAVLDKIQLELESSKPKAASTGGEVRSGERVLKRRSSKDVPTDKPQGPAFARNEAVNHLASGDWLCLLDSDDLALPSRVGLQLELALKAPDPKMVLVGGGFTRIPNSSTPGYTQWANTLKDEELTLQQWRECTVIQPTWFFHRALFKRVGGGWDEIPPRFVHSWLLEKKAQYKEKEKDEKVITAAWSNATCSLASSLPRGSLLDSPPRKIIRNEPLALAAAAPLADNADPAAASSSSSSSSGSESASTGVARDDDGEGEGDGRDEAVTTSSHAFASFPEDTLFFHRALDAGATLARVHEPVIVYRYSEGSQSWRIPRGLLLQIRVALFEERVLRLRRREKEPAAITSSGSASKSSWWSSFTIWGAGRDGKDFFNCLSDEGKALVSGFCDVDPKKIGQTYPQPPSKAELKAAAAAAGTALPSATSAAPSISRKQQKKLAWQAKLKEREEAAPAGAGAGVGAGFSTAAPTEAQEAATEPPPAKRSRLDSDERATAEDGAAGAAAMPAMPVDTVAVAAPSPPSSSSSSPSLSSVYKKIVHFSAIKPPAVVCVALGTGGRAEEVRKNVASVEGLVEGESAWFFV